MRNNWKVLAFSGDQVVCNVRVSRYYIASRVRDSLSAFPAVERIRILPIYNGRKM